MPNPTPTPMRSDLAMLCAGLNGSQSAPVRSAIVNAILALFDTATASPEPVSDTNGSNPLHVDQLLLTEETAAHIPNGFDPAGQQ